MIVITVWWLHVIPLVIGFSPRSPWTVRRQPAFGSSQSGTEQLASSVCLQSYSSPKEHLQFIILGGTGDLAMSKTVPSLLELYSNQYQNHMLLSADAFQIVIVGRSHWSTASLQEKLRHKLAIVKNNNNASNSDLESKRKLEQDLEITESFIQRCTYVLISSYSSDSLSAVLLHTTSIHEEHTADDLSAPHRRNMVIFSLPPAQYLPVLRALQRHHQYHPSTSHRNRVLETTRHRSDADAPLSASPLPRRSAPPPHLDLVIEKPIGYDQPSALRVFHLAAEAVRRHRHHRHQFAPRVWCIDHYLGKDLALCLLPLKSTPLLSLRRLFTSSGCSDAPNPDSGSDGGLTGSAGGDGGGLFSSTYVRRIRCAFCDTGTLSGRSGYFDDVGITRDILQNHLLQLLALLLCRPDDVVSTTRSTLRRESDGAKKGTDDGVHGAPPPVGHQSPVHDRRAEVLRSLRPLSRTELVRGQYEGYLKEPGVRARSSTDTLAACTVYSDLPQWRGVPLDLWAGKGVDRKESVIRIEYREDVDVVSEVQTAVRAVQLEISRLKDSSGGSSVDSSAGVSGSGSGRSGIIDVDRVQSIALVLQIQPEPGIYIELVSQSSPLPRPLRVPLLTLADVFRDPIHDPLGRALQLWPDVTTSATPASPVAPTTSIISTTPNISTISTPTIPTTPPIPVAPANTHPRPQPQEAYTRVLAALVARDERCFVSPAEVALQWRVFDSALAVPTEAAETGGVAGPAASSETGEDIEVGRRRPAGSSSMVTYSVGSSIESVVGRNSGKR